MTQLTLILDNTKSWPKIQTIAIANIYDITPDRPENQEEDKSNLLLKTNRLDIDINPGKYIAELKLPSGKLLRKEIQIQDQPTQVLFDIESPHEWLWLQTLHGNITDQKAYQDQINQTQKTTTRGLLSAPQPQSWILNSKSIFTTRAAIGSDVLKIPEGYFLLRPDKQNQQFPHLYETSNGAKIQQIRPTINDPITQIIELQGRWMINYLNLTPPIDKIYQNNDFQRSYIWTQTPDSPSQYSVLPIPWQGTMNDEFSSVQIYINTGPPKATFSKNYDIQHKLAITVDDELFSSLIGYLGSGDLPSATTILNQAKDILMYKVHNPFAAAAGAYVLLEQIQIASKQEWHTWIYNLTNFFKWFPDGAIQWAWLQLAKSDENDTSAILRHNLLEAYQRGLPYYSVGVRMLLNSLTIFAQRLQDNKQRDLSIEQALKNVQLLASRTNRTQPFTAVIAQ
jgi:hypothetical protein